VAACWLALGGVGLALGLGVVAADLLWAPRPRLLLAVAAALVAALPLLALAGGLPDRLGIGPRVALAMLATHSPNALRRAVATGDAKALTQVSGIGPKGAQKIILELKDKLGVPVGEESPLVPQPRVQPWRDQVQAGLVSLGWSARDADLAIDAVAEDFDGLEVPPISTLLRSALQKLSK